MVAPPEWPLVLGQLTDQNCTSPLEALVGENWQSLFNPFVTCPYPVILSQDDESEALVTIEVDPS